jgi:hypothetical protein
LEIKQRNEEEKLKNQMKIKKEQNNEIRECERKLHMILQETEVYEKLEKDLLKKIDILQNEDIDNI